MLNDRVSASLRSLLFLTLASPLAAQSVISTHAGVIHFFEGSVYLGDTQLQPHLGRFPSIPEGGELRTDTGRVEVLLSPDVFLRMGEKSAIRMVSNDLTNTQIEVRSGSVLIDAGKPNPDTSVTLIFRDWNVRILQKGNYRIDCAPPLLTVREGEAQVRRIPDGAPVAIHAGMTLPFAQVLVQEPTAGSVSEAAAPPTGDALSQWNTGRSESIAADNSIAAQINEDPSSRNANFDTFAYFPYLGGVPPASGLYGAYTSLVPSQVGFNSIYLPGYTYRPLLLGVPVIGSGIYYQAPYPRLGLPGRVIGVTPAPRFPVRTGPPVAPVHVGPGIGARAGHR